MSVTDKSNHRNSQELAELAQAFGKNRSGSAQRISCLGINDGYIAVLDGTDKLPYKGRVIGELPLADASNIPQKLFPSDEAVDGNHIIGSPRVYGLGGNLEVHKGVMITQKHEGRLKPLRAYFCNDTFMLFHVGCTEDISKRPQVPFRTHGRGFHIKSFKIVFHTVNPPPALSHNI